MKARAIILLLLFCFAGMCSEALAVDDDAIAGKLSDAFFGTENNSSLSAETQIGDLAADAALFAAEADIALICGGNLGRNILGGDAAYSDCRAVFKEDKRLAVVSVSPAELKDILEVGVSHIVLNDEELIDREASAWGGFPQIAGFELEYDASSLPGGRIRWIRINGQKLDTADNAARLSLCVSEDMLNGQWGYPAMSGGAVLNITYSEALFSYIQSHSDVTPSNTDSRIFSCGSKDNNLLESMHIAPLLLLIAVFIFGAVRSRSFKKHYDFKR